MALEILDKTQIKPLFVSVWQSILKQGGIGSWQDPAHGKFYEIDTNGQPGGLYGGLTDGVDKEPTFDTANKVYRPDTAIRDTAKVDNTDGLITEAVDVTLKWSETTGATASHETSASVTAGVTEEVGFEVPDIGEEKTTLSLSGTFSYADGTPTSKTETNEQSVTVPVLPPPGKIYWASVTFTEEQLDVPYSMAVHITGDSKAWPANHPVVDFKVGEVGQVIHDYGFGPDAPKWGRVGDDATITLRGTAHMLGAGEWKTGIYDHDPNGTNTESRQLGEGDPVIGVHTNMPDSGGEYHGTAQDDFIEGGAGPDHIFLYGGDDFAYGNGGADTIEATGGKNVMDGGDGDDLLKASSNATGNQLKGGAGDDQIEVDAPQATGRGGAGNDTYVLGAAAKGSVIDDGEGANTLQLADEHGPVNQFLQRAGDNLIIHVDGDVGSYDPANDIAWAGFFTDPGNSVNGLDVASVLSIVQQASASQADMA